MNAAAYRAANSFDELVDRLAQAKHGSMPIDGAVLRWFFGDDGEDEATLRWLGGLPGGISDSASSAIALVERVLPGWRWIIDSDFDRGPPYAAQVKRSGDTWSETMRFYAATPPLALLGALLHADRKREAT